MSSALEDVVIISHIIHIYIYIHTQRRMLKFNQDGMIINSEGMMVHGSSRMGGGRGQRLLTVGFIPKGAEVPRLLIHLPYLILHRQGSWFL